MSAQNKSVTIVKSKFGNLLVYENDLITSQIVEFGNHTRPEFAFATGVIQHNSKVFDLGAHIGTFSLEVLSNLGGEGKLLAVEGHPTTFNVLGMNVLDQAKRAQVFLKNGFVGNGESKFNYIEVENNSGAGHLYPSSSQEIETVSIDELVREYFEPDYIKIDIEGAEFVALSHSSYIAEQKPVLYFEVSTQQLGYFGNNKDELHALLSNLGYQFFVNTGPRNARHDYFKVTRIENLANYSDFFDVLCVSAQSPEYALLMEVCTPA
jgi:FkbM family methyltransferase